MTAAVVTLAIAIAGTLPLIAWLAHTAFAARTATADEREDHVATRGEMERTKFELAATKSRLADTERMNAALQEVLADVQATDPALPVGDVRARVLRAAQQARAAAAGNPVPASAADKVPDAPAAGGAHPALMPIDG